MSLFTVEHTPADIVKAFPQASDFFKENMIDFCCGGDKPLKDTFGEDDLDSKDLMSELNTAYRLWKETGDEPVNWDEVPIVELVDHIMHFHHEKLKEELPAVATYVDRVYQVHGGPDHPHLQDLFHLYNEFKAEMIEHTIKEEQEVFPLIKEYVEHPTEQLLKDIHEANGGLEEEHEVAGDLLKRMRTVTNGYELPVNACGSYRVMYDRLAEIESDTFEHIHLENNILFKRL